MTPDPHPTRPIRVVHVDTERTWRGGEQQVTYLVRGLLARGHHPTLVAPPDAEIRRRFDGWGYPVIPLRMRGEADLGAAVRLAGILRETRADIVHLHTAHAHTLGVMGSLLAGRAKRVVSRRVDFAVRGLSARIKYGPVVDRFIAITDAVAGVLREGGVPADRISIARSGIDLARVQGGDGGAFRRAVGVPSDVPLVGTIAHFAWHKGLEYLVRAWPEVRARHRDARLVLVGDGEDRPKLEREIADAGVADSVTLPGFRTDVPDALAALDVFVLPSVMEGLGTSILDALAAETPVVACDVGGIPEIISEGTTGRLVPARDPARLAAAIGDLLASPDQARLYASRGRERVERLHTADTMVEATLAAYALVLGDAGAGSAVTR